MASTKQIQSAMSKFIATFPQYKGRQQQLSPSSLSDGIAFSLILEEIPNLNLLIGNLKKDCKNWHDKLYNLRRVIDQIEEYFEKNFGKGLKTNDINLVEIAKNNSTSQLLKLFEVIMAVLMEAENKDDYIQNIMGLDQKSQSIFVTIIQNAMESRPTSLTQTQSNKLVGTIEQLQTENNFFKEELEHSNMANIDLQKQLKELKTKIQYLEEADIERIENQETQQKPVIDQLPHQNEQLRNMVQNMKNKLLHSAIQHQTEIARLKQQTSVFQNKAMLTSQLQQSLELYKEKYEQAQHQIGLIQAWEKEKSKLIKLLEEKENAIKKLQQRNETLLTKNCSLDQKTTYLEVQLQKRNLRFTELEKQVRSRLKNVNGTQSALDALEESMKFIMPSQKQNQQLKGDPQTNQTRLKYLQKQNGTLLKKTEILGFLELEKKRLEKAIVEIDRTRKEEVQLLLVAFYECKEENERLVEELRKFPKK